MNLILLVGTNPLPNYVTALFFKEQIKTVHLIHSSAGPNHTGTASAAKYLQKQLKSSEIADVKMVALEDVASKTQIRKALEAKLNVPNGFPVHLNYTGGTKSMAVHIYTYVQETFKDRLACSYLDALTGRIVFDDGSPSTDDLSQKISVDIDSMLGLHGYTWKKGDECRFPDALNILDEWVQSGKIADFIAWKNDYLRPIFYRDSVWEFRKGHAHQSLNDHIKQDFIKQRIEQNNRFLNENKMIISLIESLGHEKLFERAIDGAWKLKTAFDASSFTMGVKETVYRFLDGMWLEHYIRKAILDLCKKRKLTEKFFGFSLKPVRDGQTVNDLEMDAFIIKGHILNGISITTGGKSECKLKAFEVMHRIRQIGGDESRGIMIGDVSQKEAQTITATIKSELSGGEHDVHFKALGRDGWKREALERELENFIWGR